MDFQKIINRIDTEDIVFLEKDKRSNGLDIKEVKLLAESFGIVIGSKTKSELIKLIKHSRTNDISLANIDSSHKNEYFYENIDTGYNQNNFDDIDKFSDDYYIPNNTNSSSISKLFKKNKNTFPRIMNCLIKLVDKLVLSGLISSRKELQFRQNRGNHEAFRDATNYFNNPDFNSGGLLFPTDIHLIGIDPEEKQGIISSDVLYKTFNDTRSKLSKACDNFCKSGTHDNEFWKFCDNDTDTYYMHLMISDIGITELNTLVTEKTTFKNGYDSNSTNQLQLNTSTLSSNSNKSTKNQSTSAEVDYLNAKKQTEIEKGKLEYNKRKREEGDTMFHIDNQINQISKEIFEINKQLKITVDADDKEQLEFALIRKKAMLKKLQNTMNEYINF